MPFYPNQASPLQKIKTEVGEADLGFMSHVEVSGPLAASNVAVLASTALGVAAAEITTGIADPDVARALRIKGNAATVAGNVVVVGTNIADEVIDETIAANGANAVEGAKAFKTVTSITLPAQVDPADEISVGYNDKLGLPYLLSINTVLAVSLNAVREATAPTVTVSATAIESNTCDLDSALDGNNVDIFLIV